MGAQWDLRENQNSEGIRSGWSMIPSTRFFRHKRNIEDVANRIWDFLELEDPDDDAVTSVKQNQT